MKTHTLKFAMLSAILLILSGVFSSCKDQLKETAEEKFLIKLQSAPVQKESFPEWLIAKIDEIEAVYSKDVSVVKVQIFKGEWKKQTVYFIKNTLASCLLCDTYNEEGGSIIWSNDTTDFYVNSKNWNMIYEFGNGLY